MSQDGNNPETAGQTVQCIVVSECPDVCWTEVGGQKVAVPYDAFVLLDAAQEVSPDVCARGDAVVTVASGTPHCSGDEPATAGVVSGTVGGPCAPVAEHAASVRVNGHLVTHKDTVWQMNNGNTNGRCICLVAPSAGAGRDDTTEVPEVLEGGPETASDCTPPFEDDPALPPGTFHYPPTVAGMTPQWVHRQRDNLGMPRDVPLDHFLLEYLAKNIAYRLSPEGRSAPILTPNEHRMLQSWGYDSEAMEFHSGDKHLQFFVFPPAAPDGPDPIVVFRGTQPGQGADWASDTHPLQPGAGQYLSNRALIDETYRHLAAEYGDVVSTGHSLGNSLGGLSMVANASWLGSGSRMVGFQPAGVHPRVAELFEKTAWSNTIYTTKGDVVASAGSMIGGEEYWYDGGPAMMKIHQSAQMAPVMSIDGAMYGERRRWRQDTYTINGDGTASRTGYITRKLKTRQWLSHGEWWRRRLGNLRIRKKKDSLDKQALHAILDEQERLLAGGGVRVTAQEQVWGTIRIRGRRREALVLGDQPPPPPCAQPSSTAVGD